MGSPLSVSVVIPVFNCEKYLPFALESALNQTQVPQEICVVDDGSTDRSAECATGFGPKVRVVTQANLGPGTARNRGVRMAQGEWISFLDADDFWSKDKLELQMGAIESHPGVDMVFGRVRQFITPDLDESLRGRFGFQEEEMNGFVSGTLLMRRETFLKVGLYDETLKIGEFIDWYARATALGLKHRLLENTVLHRRIHGNNLTLRQKQSQADYLKILRASLQRQRKISTPPSSTQ